MATDECFDSKPLGKNSLAKAVGPSMLLATGAARSFVRNFVNVIVKRPVIHVSAKKEHRKTGWMGDAYPRHFMYSSFNGARRCSSICKPAQTLSHLAGEIFSKPPSAAIALNSSNVSGDVKILSHTRKSCVGVALRRTTNKSQSRYREKGSSNKAAR